MTVATAKKVPSAKRACRPLSFHYLSKSPPQTQVTIINAEGEETYVENMEDDQDQISDPESSSSSSSDTASQDSLHCVDEADAEETFAALEAEFYSVCLDEEAEVTNQLPVNNSPPIILVESHPLQDTCADSFEDGDADDCFNSSACLSASLLPPLERTTTRRVAAPCLSTCDEQAEPTQSIPKVLPVAGMTVFSPPYRFVANSAHIRISCLETVMVRNRKIVGPLKPRAGEWFSKEALLARRSRPGSNLRSVFTL